MSTPAQLSASPVVAVLMPQAGNSMEEGTILNWRVQPGDRVVLGQILYEVETDKASVEVEATAAGRLARIIAPAGAVVPIKHAVAYLAESDAALDAFLAGEKHEASSTKPEPAPQRPPAVATGAHSETSSQTQAPSATGRIKASPAARQIAAERNLDLARVAPGSGPQGRILSTDLARLPSRAAGPGFSAVPGAYFRQTIDAGALLAFLPTQKTSNAAPLDDLLHAAVDRTLVQLPALSAALENAGTPSLAISNLGHVGIDEFAAAIPPNQSGILAVGAIREGVLARDGVMYARRIMTVTLSVDDRIVDAPLAAAFMTKLKQILEAPASHLA